MKRGHKYIFEKKKKNMPCLTSSSLIENVPYEINSSLKENNF